MAQIDVVSTLSARRARLIARRSEIKREAEQQVSRLDAEIADIDKAIDVLNAAVKDLLCKRCNGSGTIRVCDAAGDMEDETCPVCKGTGVSAFDP